MERAFQIKAIAYVKVLWQSASGVRRTRDVEKDLLGTRLSWGVAGFFGFFFGLSVCFVVGGGLFCLFVHFNQV